MADVRIAALLSPGRTKYFQTYKMIEDILFCQDDDPPMIKQKKT